MHHSRSKDDIPGINRLERAISAREPRAEFLRLMEDMLAGDPPSPTGVRAHKNNPGRLPQTNDTSGPRGTNFSCVSVPRFIYVLGGSYRVVRELETRSADRIVKAGELYWIRPDGWNLVRNDTPRSVLSVIFEQNHTRFLWYHHKRDPEFARVRGAHIGLRYHTHSPATEELRHAIALMDAAACGQADAPTSRATARALLGWCLQELRADGALAEAAGKPGSGTRTQRTFDDICSYVSEHLQEELSRDHVARVFRVSEDHLTRLFRVHAHCGFVEYVRRERFRLAERLLSASRLSVKEIAAACGFNLSGYFIKRFRERHGVTPTAWLTTH